MTPSPHTFPPRWRRYCHSSLSNLSPSTSPSPSLLVSPTSCPPLPLPRLIVILEPGLEPAASTFPWRCNRCTHLPPPWLIVVLAPRLEQGHTRNEIRQLYKIIGLSDFAAVESCFGALAQTGCLHLTLAIQLLPTSPPAAADCCFGASARTSRHQK